MPIIGEIYLKDVRPIASLGPFFFGKLERYGPFAELARFLLISPSRAVDKPVQAQRRPEELSMSRKQRRNSLIISAALALVAVNAYGDEPTEQIDRAALQADLAPLSVDAHAQAKDVGRAIASKALTVTHCITIQPRLTLAAARSAQTDRS